MFSSDWSIIYRIICVVSDLDEAAVSSVAHVCEHLGGEPIEEAAPAMCFMTQKASHKQYDEGTHFLSENKKTTPQSIINSHAGEGNNPSMPPVSIVQLGKNAITLKINCLLSHWQVKHDMNEHLWV